MIHGLGGTVRSWDTILPALSRSREVILVDMPGHGRSPALPGRQSIAAFADAIEAHIANKGLAGVDLVGSSVGARLVLELARRGVGGNVVALDPGGFWRGWERGFFATTIGGSIRLVRLLQPIMPFLTEHAATRTLCWRNFRPAPGLCPPMSC
jgi:pimeloyl-ACP methyl ester carboxylesterase